MSVREHLFVGAHGRVPLLVAAEVAAYVAEAVAALLATLGEKG